jgi:hypothetical protein
MTSSKRLNGFYTYTPEGGGMSETFGPEDELPEWAAKQADAKHFEGETGDDVTDLPVPGPGQVAGEGMTEEEKAEARKKADRDRKAAQRAAAKKASEDEAAVKAAQEAEAQRQAELAAQQGQGGGS